MATFFQSVRQGFGRGSNRTNNQQQRSGNSPQSSPQTPYPPANMLHSPSLSSSLSVDTLSDSEGTKYFFQEKYASLNVKGNFLTLCACPKNVELGEWLAHQVVEQNRLLHALLQVIQEVNTVTGMPVCNEQSCPTMSAGRLTYTWLVDGKTAKIPAPKFINRVEKWIVSKIHDPVMFPTDPPPASAANTFASGDVSTPGSNTPIAAGPTNLNLSVASLSGQDWIGKSSGFPQTFYKDCQGIMKQMFRCYAHLYHGHWENPFWHLNKHEVLNMCFVHFITVAKYFKLVADKEMEPMQPLIDIFVKQEKIPPEAIAGHWAQASSA